MTTRANGQWATYTCRECGHRKRANRGVRFWGACRQCDAMRTFEREAGE